MQVLQFVPGPQRSDRTVRQSVGEAPLLVVSSLAGSDGVDDTTVSYLLKAALKLKKKEEEEERRKEAEQEEEEERERWLLALDSRVNRALPLTDDQWLAWRQWVGKRRKRKRRKRRTPRTS